MNPIARQLSKLALIALALGAATAVQGQFLLLTQDDDTIDELRNGSNLVFASEGVGDLVRRRVTVQFTGPDDSTLRVNEPAIAGSTRFSIAAGPDFPRQLTTGQSVDFTITFDPTNAGPFTARLDLSFVQADLNRPFDTTTNLVINLSGLVADYTLSYQLPGGNQLLLGQDEALVFDDTELDRTLSATVIVTNRGSGPGTVQGVTLAGGGAFEVSGLALLPVEVAAGRDLRFSVTFTPDQLGAFEGGAVIAFGQGSRSIRFIGQGVAPLYTFDITTPEGSQSVADRGSITLPATDVGQEIEAQVTVANRGTLDGVINRIAIAGAGFRLEDLPIIPAELDVNESFTFSMTFTPAEPGEVQGQLQIGDARFAVVGVGSGPLLTFRATTASGAAEVEARESIVFPQTPLGELNAVRMEITNSGNQDQVISLIAVTGASYSLAGLPALPSTLAAGQTVGFDINFEPAGSGPQQGSLSIDATPFTLSGAGADPPELSSVTIDGAGGATGPAQQIPISVLIAEPYPVDIAGSLSLTFESNAFSNDPSIQFSRGGRSATFRIPAGQTQALFPNGSSSIRFQTGTVSGTILIAAALETDRGRVDLTPDNPPELMYSVAPAAPELRRAQLGQTNNSGFTVQVIGFSTAREISTLQINLTAAPGATLSTTSLTADVSDAFNTWYQSNGSTGFGSQFTATVNLTVDGSASDVQSVSITATNSLGTSSPVSVALSTTN